MGYQRRFVAARQHRLTFVRRLFGKYIALKLLWLLRSFCCKEA